jgi:hypothetical protein
MLELLDAASRRVSDPPDPIELVTMREQKTGRPGRPRKEVDPHFLAFALEARGPSGVAQFFKCSPRTIRRRALDHGILPPGKAPFCEVQLQDQTTRIRTGDISNTRLSAISDEDLDGFISNILRDSPNSGRKMIDGRLKAQSIRVSRERIAKSFLRVRGTRRRFRERTFQRRRYFVAGVNSLWHHDGQHGLRSFSLLMAYLTPLIRIDTVQARSPRIH